MNYYEVVTVLTVACDRVELSSFRCDTLAEANRVAVTLLAELAESEGDVELVVRYVCR